MGGPPNPDDTFSYDAMRAAIEKGVPAEAAHETLIAAMKHLRSVEGTDAFDSAYEHLKTSAEAHIDLLGPFISAFSRMFGA